MDRFNTEEMLVCVDGSPESWRAFDVALDLAAGQPVRIEVLWIRFDPSEVADIEREMYEEVSRRDVGAATVRCTVELAMYGIDGIVAAAKQRGQPLLVMASHGRGRSASVFGSVTEGVLRSLHQPILVVGPHVETSNGQVEQSHPNSETIVVPIDGTPQSEAAVPLGVEVAKTLGAALWIVESLPPASAGAGPADVADTAVVHRLAASVRQSGVDIEFEALHGGHVDVDVADFAARNGARMIVASTHAREGFDRLKHGSTGAGIVRHATCPVLMLVAE